MHLIEQYALSCGAKINKPYIREKYFPIPANNYITFSPRSKPSKNYDYWKEVLSMIVPPLSKIGVALVQLGEEKDPKFDGCIDLRGKTSIAQAAYLIKRAVMQVGTDSFATHMASAFGRKVVSLYSNSPVQNCKPYWSKQEDCVLLESDRQGLKHSFAIEENPKTINTIAPEEIALSVFKLLGLQTKVKHKTVQIGSKWNNEFLEVVPSHVATFSKPAPKDRHVIRMDYHFNEEVMTLQLKSNPGLIVTNKPISIDRLVKSKELIEQVIYLVEDDKFQADFVRDLDRSGIQNSVFTDLKGEELDNLKYKLLNLNKGIALIESKTIESVRNHDKINIDKLMFRSKKFIIEKDKIYPGKAAYLNKRSIENFDSEPIPIFNQKEFWDEVDFFWLTEKV
tara:strand:- start:888 stop:2072 length:1185 start_codon:yes stop_codon:yes gene_type:complete